jgi:LacI family transcriptional regulator
MVLSNQAGIQQTRTARRAGKAAIQNRRYVSMKQQKLDGAPPKKNLVAPSLPVGIKEIAKALGVSIGTVDRALHGRSGINPVTRARVLKMAKTLGYRPNVAARYLKLGRKLRISVHLPREVKYFFDSLHEGIAEAAAPFESMVELTFRTVRRLGEGEPHLFREALEQGTDGIIVAPGHPDEIRPWIRKASHSHVPVVCVSTDAPKTERLTAVCADPFTSGCMAAEYLLMLVHQPGSVLAVTGDLATVDHSEKLRGFREFLSHGSHLALEPVIQAHDDPEEAYQSVRHCLENTSLKAVYVSTANSLPVLRALSEANRLGNLVVITTDLFPELADYIRDGSVMGTIYQLPQTQGRTAFQALYQFLVEGKCPPSKLHLAPYLISRSNLALHLPALSGTSQNESILTAPGPYDTVVHAH